MIKLRLHQDATARTLASARILVGMIWLVRMATFDLVSLAHLPIELFQRHGVLGLVPMSIWEPLLQPPGLACLQWTTLILLVATIFGIGRRIPLLSAAILLTVILGISKGFGGHVDHRELVLLFVTWLMMAMPCWDALAFGQPNRTDSRNQVYASCLQVLCAVILLNYFFVGIARLTVGFPGVFAPDVMFDWVLSRNVRPNPFGWSVGTQLLDSAIGRTMLAVALPISTAIEIAAPICLWCRAWLRWSIVASLAVFHLSIFFIMNIPFFENIVLLSLLVGNVPSFAGLAAGWQRPAFTSWFLHRESHSHA